MALTKAQTALHIQGSTVEFWKLLNEYAPDCYDQVAANYDSVEDLEETTGTDPNGDPINIEGYPMRQRPNHRPTFED